MAGANTSCVLILTKIEVQGFNKLTLEEKIEFELFFSEINILTVTEEIANVSIQLRQTRKISLPDSIIAATALVNNMPLVTANIKDFKWIDGLALINPIPV